MYKHIVRRSYSKMFRSLDKPSIKNLKDVGREIGMDASRVTRLVNDWTGEGLVKKKDTKHGYKIKLTKQGKQLKNLLEDFEELNDKLNK